MPFLFVSVSLLVLFFVFSFRFVFLFLANVHFFVFWYVRLSCMKKPWPWLVRGDFICDGWRGQGVYRAPNGLVHILISEKLKIENSEK